MSTIVPEDHHHHSQRRIRHIKSIQIRNLTPFPARDTIAQTLTQPSRNSVILPQYPTDDIDLVAFRRRRRISSGSIIPSLNPDTEDSESTSLTSSVAIRKRSASKSSLQTSSSPPTSRRLSSNFRPPLNSTRHVVSFVEDDALRASDTQIPSPLFVIHSQKHLEKIISSRLIETFITLSPLSLTGHTPSSPLLSPTPTPSSPNAVVSAPNKSRELPNKKVLPGNKSEHRKSPSVSLGNSHKSSSAARTPVTPVATSRSRIGGSQRASTSKTNFTSPPTPPPESPRAKLHNPSTKPVSNKKSSSRTSDDQQDEPEPAFPTPFYISPIHKPSTNPMFTHLDPEREFANWADITSPRFQVIIWGCSNQTDKFTEDVKGKGKETIDPVTESTFMKPNSSWQILDEWIVDLDEAELLTSDNSSQTYALPSNTLLITLSSRETFRVSPISAEHRRAANLRSHSPIEPDYNSDGDIERLRAEKETTSGKDIARSLRETRMKKSATYQDLVKLINLQTVIADTRELLENTIISCNTLIESDNFNPLSREISELEEWVETLRSGKARVKESIVGDSLKLEERRKVLQQRRDRLAVARDLYRAGVEEYSERKKELATERERHAQLAPQLPALRTSLLYLVNFIFPIEPVSPPDLLFAILGAPLPVPQSSTDPAPPISMPKFPSVSEESVSTALGYVAQVVQLVSAYLGQILVYPVTCYGSRSIIKDPVSAMAGPRVFPLYSKGVETYRFEYGVYLLNKNIEMLMSERNLRALDIRHTLPNLKNLMLTLTMGEEVKPMSEQTKLSECSKAISPVSPSFAPLMMQTEVNTSLASTTVSTEQPPRKSTPFLSPFTALLRSRYPSSLGRPKIKPVDETPEQTEDTEPAVVAFTPSALSFQIEVTTNESKDISPREEIRDATLMNGSPLEKYTLNDRIMPPSPPVIQTPMYQ
ncbi:hypothetical protein Clacol_008180 [Clathrus columnatus]|uniref:Autophagy-related protein 14 n=1 Tax=Clathrus columnatus TaxID=1419009 RepID=A0AAV5AKA7_9AGAM|nr:hypothetical protein Clacol_008180 [Clathrus columnatus]